MANTSCPRLSNARHLLPLLRSHLVAAAHRYPLPSGLELELLPIVEDGLFGYELVPHRPADAYLTIGCSDQGGPVVRRTLYGVGARTLRLATVNGDCLCRDEQVEHGSLRRDARLPDWAAAAKAALAQLLALFPQPPGRPVLLHEDAHRGLDEALAIAHAHLARWNPLIRFCGIPNEAQQGFALTSRPGERGELILQQPDIWLLRWKAPPQAVYESWSVALAVAPEARDLGGGDRASQSRAHRSISERRPACALLSLFPALNPRHWAPTCPRYAHRPLA